MALDNSPEGVMHRLIDTIGLDNALKYAADNGLKSSKDPSGSDDERSAAERDAARAAERAKAESTNPFKRGPNFSLKEQGRLYSNPATRALAISLAKSAGVTLPEKPGDMDLIGNRQQRIA